ncbi:hypothetical protein RFI_10926, partial [Reticulomyxa filosa]
MIAYCLYHSKFVQKKKRVAEVRECKTKKKKKKMYQTRGTNNNNKKKTNNPEAKATDYVTNEQKILGKFGSLVLFVPGFDRNKPSHVILAFHGNGVDLGIAAQVYRNLAKALAVHVFIAEYPGYGMLKGDCNPQTVIDHSENLYDFIVGKLGVDPSRLIILGQSIGTGVASALAHREHHMLVLISPFSSIQQLAQEKYTPKFGKSLFTNLLQRMEEPAKDANHSNSNSNGTPKTTEPVKNRGKGSWKSPSSYEGEENSIVKRQEKQKKHNNEDEHASTNADENKTEHAHEKDSNDQSHENRAKSPKQSKVKLFDNIKCVESMRCKQVYLFHGVNDDIIPLQHSEALENKILQVQQQSANGILFVFLAVFGITRKPYIPRLTPKKKIIINEFYNYFHLINSFQKKKKKRERRRVFSSGQ